MKKNGLTDGTRQRKPQAKSNKSQKEEVLGYPTTRIEYLNYCIRGQRYDVQGGAGNIITITRHNVHRNTGFLDRNDYEQKHSFQIPLELIHLISKHFQ